MVYTITPPKQISGRPVKLPASKSISNRALVLNVLSGGKHTVDNLSDSDDTNVMMNAFSLENEAINIGAAGTAMRFLTAYLAQKEGTHTITGSERMKMRPIKILVEALRYLGAEIEYAGKEGFPPLKITGHRLKGGKITVAGNISSQYISALMMIAPKMLNGLEIKIDGRIVSRPYIDMTAELMRKFGVEIQQQGNVLFIPKCEYAPVTFRVESDWSAASYFYEIAALARQNGVKIPLDGLTKNSLQGDARVAELFNRLGIETEFTATGIELQNVAQYRAPEYFHHDFTDTPDLAQTLAVTACMSEIKFCFNGLQSLRIKETDRIVALGEELKKLGYVVEISDDGLQWKGEKCEPYQKPVISTYEDHRMAMAFAPACLKLGSIGIADPEVVSKSYPGFWESLSEAGFEIKKNV
ncbi:MAG: 3-phosphoshikimate 1-carboxyvinyltransferase [Dysgonamonadaceae bacterium]|jgi:3-phosphoshikimate 1-carboxyvinyltransferase|nr:3-phosphoshikimate 1-carboxyvinyltransferase [Dysgonamonadaceae bacterium]